MKKLIILSLLLLTFIGCAYYNTMFNANLRYETATNKLDASSERAITPEIKKDYEASIDKCWKLINNHGEDSDYADDALLLISKCYFQMEDYVKSQRFLEQFISRYQESSLFDEAKLWLGRTFMKLNADDKAVNYLNMIIQNDDDDQLTAMSWFALGELEQKRKSYENAIKNYRQCLDYTDDDNLAARALFIIGEIYLELTQYENAADTFDEVLDYDVPDEVAFNAYWKKVDALIAEKDFELTLSTLYIMVQDSRFIKKLSLIDARFGDCYALQGNVDQAEEQYKFVMVQYPRTPGSGNAAYALAGMMETRYADLDSAKKLYDKVKQEDRNSEFIKLAGERAALLEQYLKLRLILDKDIAELLAVQSGDTSVVFEEGADTTETGKKKVVPKAKRTVEEILKTLDKNRFSLAEYFLLTMQNYDSALVTYQDFVISSQDTALRPKALFSIAYIHQYDKKDTVRSDSLYDVIIHDYPSSPYTEYILKARGQLKNTVEESGPDSSYLEFLRAEEYMSRDLFEDAIGVLANIAENDSGSTWAQKSRYAIAWIYENKLDSIDAAIEAYGILVNEYPNTDYAKKAGNKIKPPPEEKIPSAEIKADSTSSDSTMSDMTVSDSTNSGQVNEPMLEKEASALGRLRQTMDQDTVLNETKVDTLKDD